MSQLNDPNREAVGLSPIWTGAGDPPPEGEAQAKGSKAKKKADDESEESSDS